MTNHIHMQGEIIFQDCGNDLDKNESLDCNDNQKIDDYSYNYNKYRGKCKEFCDKLVLENPKLKLVKGFYYDWIDDVDYPHWWCVDENDQIIDPTKKQFRCQFGQYTEFNGLCTCEQCGKEFHEEDEAAVFHGNYACCSTKCMMRLVGL